MNTQFWFGVGIGALGMLIVLALIFPDDWSTWLATRRNLPTWLMPLGVIALLAGLGNLVYALGLAIIEALANINIVPWVWWATIIGLFVVVLYVVVRSIGSRRGH